MLGRGAAMTEEQLVAALRERGLDLGVDPAEAVGEVLDGDDLPLVLPLGDGRHALLPALLNGRMFTRRVSAVEVEHGFLNLSPDLEPVSILTDDETYRRLVDGSAGVEALSDLDAELFTERGIPLDEVTEGAWLLERDGAETLETLDPKDHPEIAAALKQMTRQHQQAWLDEQIPALAAATPREAAADPTRRPDLIRLLDNLGPGGPGAMDADRLRGELGL